MIFRQQILEIKKDEELEEDPKTCLKLCLENFLAKKGTIHSFNSIRKSPIEILRNDAIYPICSGGICRSQTLWGILNRYKEHIVLFPPHAARHGWDPYNGQVNRFRNQYAQEIVSDGFVHYFGFEKQVRFGFDLWESEPKKNHERLAEILNFYSENYFGPNSSWEGKRGERRVYIAFANNVHVALHRLCQSNQLLTNVILVSIDYEDLISHPLPEWQIVPRSVAAYARFSAMLLEILDLNTLN